MKKYFFICLVLMMMASLSACAKETATKEINLTDVENARAYINYDSETKKAQHILEFDKVEDATRYRITFNTGKSVDITETSMVLDDYGELGKTIAMSIRAIYEDEYRLEGSTPVTFTYKLYKIPEGLIYTELDDGTYMVDASSCENEEITGNIALPDYYNMKEITELATKSFDRTSVDMASMSYVFNTYTTGITLPKFLKKVDSQAFLYCTNLTSVTFPETLTEIGSNAFVGCSSLKEITLPSSLTSINSYLFTGCTALTSITIPEGVTEIGANAFQNCSALKEVNLPSTLKKISNSAFYMKNGSVLAKLTLPEGLEYIGQQAFQGCTKLNIESFPESLEYVGTYAFYNTKWYDAQPAGQVYINNVLYEWTGTYPDVLTTDDFKEGTVCISCLAFNKSETLVSVTIPKTVKYLGTQLFYLCTALKNVNFEEGSELEVIGQSCFASCTALTSLTLPDTVKEIGTYGIYGCTALTDVHLSTSLSEISSALFCKSTSLETVEIPSGVTKICYSAFQGCTALKSVKFPSSLKEIEYAAFSGCTSFESAYLPEGFETLGPVDTSYASADAIATGVFYNCSLKVLVLPKSLKVFGFGTVSKNNGTVKIVINGNIENFTYNAITGTTAEIYYNGNAEDFNKQTYLQADGSYSESNSFSSTEGYKVYSFSAVAPATSGDYWHYIDEEPTKWE